MLTTAALKSMADMQPTARTYFNNILVSVTEQLLDQAHLVCEYQKKKIITPLMLSQLTFTNIVNISPQINNRTHMKNFKKSALRNIVSEKKLSLSTTGYKFVFNYLDIVGYTLLEKAGAEALSRSFKKIRVEHLQIAEKSLVRHENNWPLKLPYNALHDLKRLVAEINGDVVIGADSSRSLVTFMANFCTAVMIRAKWLLDQSSLQTLSDHELEYAIRLLVPFDLGTLACRAGADASSAFLLHQHTQENDRISRRDVGNVGRSMRVMRRNAADIHLSISPFEKYMRNGYGNGSTQASRISATAPVYLAAVCDFLIGEILDTTIEHVQQVKKVIIKPAHLQTALMGDEDFARLLNMLNMRFL